MSHRPGKQKSGNVVLLAGYTHGAIGYDRSGAERKFGGYGARFVDTSQSDTLQRTATQCNTISCPVNKWVHNIDRLRSKTSFPEDFTSQLAVWKRSRAGPGIALHMN
jgi:hypothetical protein